MPAQSNHEDVMSDWKKQQIGEGQEPQNAVNVHIYNMYVYVYRLIFMKQLI